MNTKKYHQYRITIEEITQDSDNPQSLSFEYLDREDLFKLIENLKQGTDLPEETTKKIGVGIRLLGTTMMKNHKHPLFSDFMPHFKNFMINLKNTVKDKLKH
ncbi:MULTISPECIES: DUF3861 domain-containing protein [unclassified Photobacterium]|uniref:DUF3861 domain-containing protein n=1 Tax=unclassified Photobacterium TaxID=2628852 RepID=UPI001EDF73FE|nr:MULTISPECIES: DUF3861 domain-containing protein [unclassified Photobacterium]MCG3865828.1 DUF3861 domain-containing protein [Photobacterium sp. Ph6]MCG3877303.1 DUF3861 domain-containing protein [Photobacterium sp. Ph5]